jgi:hypothetical protein
METSVGEVVFALTGAVLGWRLGVQRDEVWRWVCARVLRRPVGWPTPVQRELVADVQVGEQQFPRVPPTFMTASEHRAWLRNEDHAAADQLWRETVEWARSETARRVGLEPDGWAAEQMRGAPGIQRALARQQRAAQGLLEEDDQRRREAQLAAMGAPGWSGWRR